MRVQINSLSVAVKKKQQKIRKRSDLAKWKFVYMFPQVFRTRKRVANWCSDDI